MAHIIVTRISSAKINLMANLAMGSQPSVGWECIFLSQEQGREEEEDQMVTQWHKLPQREWKMTGTQLLSLLSCWRCPVLKSSHSISRGLYAVLLIFQISCCCILTTIRVKSQDLPEVPTGSELELQSCRCHLSLQVKLWGFSVTCKMDMILDFVGLLRNYVRKHCD